MIDDWLTRGGPVRRWAVSIILALLLSSAAAAAGIGIAEMLKHAA